MTSGRLFVESMPRNVQTGAGLLLVGEDILFCWVVGSRRGADVDRLPAVGFSNHMNVVYKEAKMVNRNTGGSEESIQQRGSVRKDVAQPCPRLLPLPEDWLTHRRINQSDTMAPALVLGQLDQLVVWRRY